MLRTEFIGNVGADPERRYSQKGSAIASFRVAINQRLKDAQGEWQESTEWFRVRAGGNLADRVQRLDKGARVYVSGRLEISRYQSKEGEARVSYDVWADDVLPLNARAEQTDGSRAERDSRAETAAELDDLPF